jgi:hypothetical protein
VRVAPAAERERRVWPPDWRMEAGADGWATLRLAPPGDDAGGETAQEPDPKPEGLT